MKTAVGYAWTWADNPYWQFINVIVLDHNAPGGNSGSNFGVYQNIDAATSYSLPDNVIYSWELCSNHIAWTDSWDVLWNVTRSRIQEY
jgi:hypothetical protein